MEATVEHDGGLDVTLEHQKAGEEPLVHVEFDRPASLGAGDVPLVERLLQGAHVVLRDVDATLVRDATIRFGAQVRAGSHEIPLAGGTPFRIVAEEGCVAGGTVEIRPPDEGPANLPIVRFARVEISPPLRLPNVVEALVQVQHLFDDPAVRETLRLVAAMESSGARGLTSMLGRLTRAIAGDGGSDDFATRLRDAVGAIDRRAQSGRISPGEVLLSSISFRARRRRGRWELVPGFSGQVRLLDRMTWPFWDVELPSQLLPTLHASLSELLSGDPVATAEMRKDLLKPLPLVRALAGAVESAQGELGATFDVPAIEVRTVAGDRTLLTARVALPQGARLAGSFSLTYDRGRVKASIPEATLEFAGHDGTLKASIEADGRVNLGDGDLPPWKRLTGKVRVTLRKRSRLPRVDFSVASGHPLAVGGASYLLVARDIELAGGGTASWDGRRLAGGPVTGGIEFRCKVEMPPQVMVRRAKTTLSGDLSRGVLSGALRRAPGKRWRVSFEGEARLRQELEARVTPIPELRIGDDRLTLRVDSMLSLKGGAGLRLRPGEEPTVAVTPGGSARLRLTRAELELDGRRAELPVGTEVRGTWRGGEISPSGIGELALDLAWDLHGKPCLLHGEGRSVSLLTDALRKGELTLDVSPGGSISFSGERRGLYGVRFFNALLDPAREPEQWIQVMQDDDALKHIVSALELFDPDLAGKVQNVRDFAERVRRHLEREGVKRPGDAIPRSRIAHLLSLLLVDSDSLEDRLVPLVRDVTEGKGLDLDATKSILRGPLHGRRLDYEVDGLLRWFDLVTRPTDPMPPPVAVDEDPLVEDRRWARELRDLPSAAEIYQKVAAEEPAAAFLERLADLAPYLDLAQLDYALDHATAAWPSTAVRRLGSVRDLKRRVARVDDRQGTVAWASQSPMIARFLGEAIGPLSAMDGLSAVAPAWPPPCSLGPRDVAVLMQAGLAEPAQGVQTQVNNRMLLELVRSRPGEFLREVLVESSHQVPRVLSGILYALLHQDQDEMRDPIDVAALLEEKLGLAVPRRPDYLAGGRRARESYYEALSDLADGIFAQSGPALARRAWLREVRHEGHARSPLPRRANEVGNVAEAAEAAQAAIEAADRAGRSAGFGTGGKAARTRACTAYRKAFDACAQFLRQVPEGFAEPWMKAFWRRNEEALKVLSVVRNCEEDVDDVRHWLNVTSGHGVPREEQSLLETVVRTLFWRPEDQEILLADPLVRLLIEPPPGRYDFSIVSCMGVVTDGADGRELEDAYRRIEERRGVRVVRAHTGLFRSLEYNAAAIIRAVQQTSTPWGYIGYSQGCPNGLLAESFLHGGTPAQRKLLDRFVARNLLYSAANGSAHGSSGALKFLRAMAEGERFLKHYQAQYSREVTEIVFRAMRAGMDSQAFVNSVGGTYSLTMERARVLHRDGQFVPWVPTSTTRGVVAPDRLPEALEYLYHVHQRLMPGVACDTQVPADEAVGHSTRVRNAWTDAFARCDIGSFIQSTHHWAPLTAEVEFVTTERDVARAVYQSPKDRHVFPWVEVNARFGRIHRSPA